ncbi:hypothetical protein OsI_03326 [Oryza sativa Indica Group]|uniref:Uncharacterized protein n=1 Tax=Oryza sativa subsp. indica TaxID=39946 RepID=B8A7P2_ORYSI|nr:hypothetical protein OsI_03326 [Oryza sativa Indica Group]
MAETGDQHGPVIGIDLGTACSCVAVWQNGRAEIVTNEHGGRATPSYAAFTDAERLVGDAAKSQASRNPTNTVFATKRLMGRRFSDASVQDGLKLWPFKVVPGRGDKPMVAASYKGKQKLLAAEEVASMLLSKMKAEAEAYIGGPVKNAVVTVPASFDVLQRRATKHACAVAGLDVLGVIHRPAAAAERGHKQVRTLSSARSNLPGAHSKAKPGVKLSVSVCFSIDADGVLTVSARDKVNGHKNQMRVMEQSQLSKEEIERMTMEAKEYMAADEEKERIKAKNLLEEFLHNKGYNGWNDPIHCLDGGMKVGCLIGLPIDISW